MIVAIMHMVIAGNHPELTKAELLSLDPRAKMHAEENGVFFVEFHAPPAEIFQKTGGVIKAAEWFLDVPTFDEETLAAILTETLPNRKGRVSFGISAYGHTGGDVKKLGMQVKRLAQERGMSCRFVVDRSPALGAATILKNHLLEEGAEFVLVQKAAGMAIGQTVFIQPIDAWSVRDYGRPSRDAHAGMLPPKLARIMVNLAGNKMERTLWDPFCGSGTVLTEAVVLGYTHVYGSDIKEDALAATEKNLSWIEQQASVSFEALTFKHDARDPLPADIPQMFDAIVAEGTLGPPERKTAESFSKIIQELEEFYRVVIPTLVGSLERNGVLVLAVPFFRSQGEEHFLSLGTLSKERWTYARPDQHVGREIWRIKTE
ncbi:hypothetical protein HYW18_02465 [Candidatus Uhrbacteria bacterium]|nr:hypothetical protein [Candidatus Uhrbacteria bacterium]